MTRSIPACRQSTAKRLFAATAFAAVGLLHSAAWAQSNPYFIGASQAFSHDSNVFRVDKRFGPISDTVSATSLFAGVEQPWGRQRLYANVGLEYNVYNRLSRLDFLGTDISAGIDWATVHRLSGTLNYSRKEGQGDYSRPGAATQGKNVQETQRAEATAKYELTPRLAVVGGLEYREINVDNRAYASSEVAGQVARLGVTYSFSPVLTVSTGLRYTEDRRGSAIQVGVDQLVPQKTHGRDIDFTANWVPTQRINMNGRISFGDETQSQGNSRSSSRVTGALSAQYTPTSRLIFDASVSRDTGIETTFKTSPTGPTAPTSPAPVGNNGPRGFFVDSNRLTTSYMLGARYVLTQKIGLTAGYDRSQGSYQNPNGQNDDNNTNRYSLGAQYAALSNLVLGCSVRRETRSGSGAITVNSGVQAYTSNSFSCSLRYVIH
jgi:hypothetical protein